MDVEFSTLKLLDLVAVAVPSRGDDLPPAARVIDSATAAVVQRLADHPETAADDDGLGAHPAARRLNLEALVIAAERHVARDAGHG